MEGGSQHAFVSHCLFSLFPNCVHHMPCILLSEDDVKMKIESFNERAYPQCFPNLVLMFSCLQGSLQVYTHTGQFRLPSPNASAGVSGNAPLPCKYKSMIFEVQKLPHKTRPHGTANSKQTEKSGPTAKPMPCMGPIWLSSRCIDHDLQQKNTERHDSYASLLLHTCLITHQPHVLSNTPSSVNLSPGA